MTYYQNGSDNNMFKPYRPKRVPKTMGAFGVQIGEQLNKQMGPATVPKRFKVFNKGKGDN